MAAEIQSVRKRRPPSELWLSKHSELPLNPEIPIIDAHHHLWDLEGWGYLLPELLSDLDCGHDIKATVYVSSGTRSLASGPVTLRPVGETEFARGVADANVRGRYGSTDVCAGIIAHADLRLGAKVCDVLDAHLNAGGARLKGIRHSLANDAEAALVRPGNPAEADLLESESFREGFASLASRDLIFEAWLYHPQIDSFVDFALRFPNTRIVVNHFGGPLGCGQYRRDDVFPVWAHSISRLAKCENIWLKLGGLGMPINGFNLFDAPVPATSADLANVWRPYFDTALTAFTPTRCMFESNFPVDKISYSYGTFWNACKRLAKSLSDPEKHLLFSKTAAIFYGLPIPSSTPSPS